MDRTTMINEILKNQNRANDHIFTKEKLEKFNFEILSLVYETSKHMITKLQAEHKTEAETNINNRFCL